MLIINFISLGISLTLCRRRHRRLRRRRRRGKSSRSRRPRRQGRARRGGRRRRSRIRRRRRSRRSRDAPQEKARGTHGSGRGIDRGEKGDASPRPKAVHLQYQLHRSVRCELLLRGQPRLCRGDFTRQRSAPRYRLSRERGSRRQVHQLRARRSPRKSCRASWGWTTRRRILASSPTTISLKKCWRRRSSPRASSTGESLRWCASSGSARALIKSSRATTPLTTL